MPLFHQMEHMRLTKQMRLAASDGVNSHSKQSRSDQSDAQSMREVHRVTSLSSSAIDAALRSGEPFVISISETDVPGQEVSNLKSTLSGKTIFGWQNDKAIELSIDEVVDLWLDDRLPCNIVDSYVKVRWRHELACRLCLATS